MEQNVCIYFPNFLIRFKDAADAAGALDAVGAVAACNKRYGDKQNDGKDDREHGDDHGKLRVDAAAPGDAEALADAAAMVDVVATADAAVAEPSQILRQACKQIC